MSLNKIASSGEIKPYINIGANDIKSNTLNSDDVKCITLTVNGVPIIPTPTPTQVLGDIYIPTTIIPPTGASIVNNQTYFNYTFVENILTINGFVNMNLPTPALPLMILQFSIPSGFSFAGSPPYFFNPIGQMAALGLPPALSAGYQQRSIDNVYINNGDELSIHNLKNIDNE